MGVKQGNDEGLMTNAESMGELPNDESLLRLGCTLRHS